MNEKEKFIAILKGLECEGCGDTTYRTEPLPCLPCPYPYDEDRLCNCCDVCRRICRNAGSDLW